MIGNCTWASYHVLPITCPELQIHCIYGRTSCHQLTSLAISVYVSLLRGLHNAILQGKCDIFLHRHPLCTAHSTAHSKDPIYPLEFSSMNTSVRSVWVTLTMKGSLYTDKLFAARSLFKKYCIVLFCTDKNINKRKWWFLPYLGPKRPLACPTYF